MTWGATTTHQGTNGIMYLLLVSDLALVSSKSRAATTIAATKVPRSVILTLPTRLPRLLPPKTRSTLLLPHGLFHLRIHLLKLPTGNEIPLSRNWSLLFFSHFIIQSPRLLVLLYFCMLHYPVLHLRLRPQFHLRRRCHRTLSAPSKSLVSPLSVPMQRHQHQC